MRWAASSSAAKACEPSVRSSSRAQSMSRIRHAAQNVIAFRCPSGERATVAMSPLTLATVTADSWRPCGTGVMGFGGGGTSATESHCGSGASGALSGS